MSSIYVFVSAAMPWIALGLLLAVFCVRSSSRKRTQKKKDDYSSEGMSIETCGDCSEMSSCEKLEMITGNNEKALKRLKG